ncbi:MAG TPA: YncE family protein [Candidatus Baltobacteraceae bacterium]|jgi:DNA-binding beta-propeller fold protein YncE
MPIVAAPPQQIAAPGGFDYVTVDAVRRRVYAAHGGASDLLIVDADTGKVLGSVKVGPMAGVAVDPANGHVFTGDGGDNAISEVDPVTMKEINRVAVSGHVDAIAYDPTLHRIYGDEDDGTQIFVIDSQTFKQIGSVALPGHKPEYLQIDPKTHVIYQNIANMSEIAVIDPTTLKVTRTIATPELTNNHPLQLDVAHGELLAGGENMKFSVYKTDGTKVQTIDFPTRVDQCDLDQATDVMACAGGGKLTMLKTDGAALTIVGQTAVSDHVHTTAIDSKTGSVFVVSGDKSGAFVQKYTFTP